MPNPVRILLPLTLVAAFIGCNRTVSPSKRMSSDVTSVQAGDPGMEAAMQQARDRFPEFWREIATDSKRVIPVHAGAMIKAYFFDPEAPLDGEHMWVRGVEYDGRLISGTLADTPTHVRSVRAGQNVSFPLERLSDWLYIRDGKAYGVFTVRLLRARMSPEERLAHDSHYPFRFE